MRRCLLKLLWKSPFSVMPDAVLTRGTLTPAACSRMAAAGEYDPWRGGGVLESPNPTILALDIPGAAHHLDLMFPHPSDSEEVSPLTPVRIPFAVLPMLSLQGGKQVAIQTRDGRGRRDTSEGGIYVNSTCTRADGAFDPSSDDAPPPPFLSLPKFPLSATMNRCRRHERHR